VDGRIGTVNLLEPLAKKQQVMMRIIEPGQHGCAAQIDVPADIDEVFRLVGGADPGDAAILYDYRFDVWLSFIHSDERGVREKHLLTFV